MDFQNIGRLLLLLGIGVAILGGLLLVVGRVFPSFGSLPGDLRAQGENFSCFVPFTSMILLSIILTVVVNVILRLLNR